MAIVDADGNPLAIHGFRSEKGNFSEVNVPDSGTLVRANNARGDFAGSSFNSFDLQSHGFVSSTGRFITVDVPFPGTSHTVPGGINASEEIVGQ